MQFTVTAQDLADGATSCQLTADEIWQQLQSLSGYVQSLEATYHGVAANTFQALMVDYQTYATMLYNALRDIGQGLHGNFYNYTDTEQAAVQTLVQVNNEFPGNGSTLPVVPNIGPLPVGNFA